MTKDTEAAKPIISKRLQSVLDQLGSVLIFDKERCGIVHPLDSMQENESDNKEIPPDHPSENKEG